MKKKNLETTAGLILFFGFPFLGWLFWGWKIALAVLILGQFFRVMWNGYIQSKNEHL